jgi:hypothetical protein
MLPVLLVSDQSERRAHLRRTCRVIVLTVVCGGGVLAAQIR